MAKFHILVAYGGDGAEDVAVDMAKCLTKKGLKAHIAVAGLKESIDVSSESGILSRLKDREFDGVLAISTNNSKHSKKFEDEIEAAKYDRDNPIPVIAFLKKDRRDALPVLEVGCSRVIFEAGNHNAMCAKVSSMIRYVLHQHIRFLRQPRIITAKQTLRRRNR